MTNSMHDTHSAAISGTTHLTIAQAVTENGVLFEALNGELTEAIHGGAKFEAGQQGTLLVALGVPRDGVPLDDEGGRRDEIFVEASPDGATPVHVIVRAIEVLEQLRDDLRAAGQI